MARYFFRPSIDAQKQLTDFFHFMWPTAAALWNLRWQVAGFKAAFPLCSERELESRFVLGSGIHGASLHQACIAATWTQNQETFAHFLLFQTFSIYESWISDVLDLLSVRNRDWEKGLQFPTDAAGNRGILPTVANLTAVKSPILEAAYYLPHTKAAPFDANLLERLMCVYRAFKECRNCIAHGGGECSALAKQACDDFARITNPADIGVKEIPIMPAQVVGSPIALSLRGCVGFSDIVLKIIAILDLELSRCLKAEAVLIDDLLRRTDPKDRGRVLKAEPKARRRQVGKIIYGLGYPKFTVTDELCDKLKTKKVIRY